MSNTFNISRFGSLMKKQSVENYKGYLMALAVVTSVLAIWMGYYMFMTGGDMDNGILFGTFFFMLIGSGTVFTCGVFPEPGNKRMAASWFTLPATILEKYMVRWVFTYLLYPLIFTGIFYLILEPLRTIFHTAKIQNQQTAIITYTFIYMEVFIMYGLFHAIALYGSVYFNKMHFIKTAFVVIALTAAVFVVNRYFLQGITGAHVLRANPFSSFLVFEENRYMEVEINNPEPNKLMNMVILITTVILWVAAYFRLKEKQA